MRTLRPPLTSLPSTARTSSTTSKLLVRLRTLTRRIGRVFRTSERPRRGGKLSGSLELIRLHRHHGRLVCDVVSIQCGLGEHDNVQVGRAYGLNLHTCSLPVVAACAYLCCTLCPACRDLPNAFAMLARIPAIPAMQTSGRPEYRGRSDHYAKHYLVPRNYSNSIPCCSRPSLKRFTGSMSLRCTTDRWVHDLRHFSHKITSNLSSAPAIDGTSSRARACVGR